MRTAGFMEVKLFLQSEVSCLYNRSTSQRKLPAKSYFHNIMKKGGFVYIITNQYNTVLYTGVTSALRARIFEHRTKYYPKSFSAKYNCNRIVWYQFLPYIVEAIAREKQIKAGSRKAKETLINTLNPAWKDLWTEIQEL